VYVVCMARINVYLPEDLAEEARAADLNVSALAQGAIRSALAARSTDAWLSTLEEPATRPSHAEVLAAIDAARDEPTTHHG